MLKEDSCSPQLSHTDRPSRYRKSPTLLQDYETDIGIIADDSNKSSSIHNFC